MHTKDTAEEQALEIMIKISHEYLVGLIDFADSEHKYAVTKAEIIRAVKRVDFNMDLVEDLLIPKDQVAIIMRDGIEGVSTMLLDVLEETGKDIMPIVVLKNFEKTWDWKNIFKSVMEHRDKLNTGEDMR